MHAYDLNMQIPDTPVQQIDDDSMDAQSGFSPERRPSLLIESNSVFFRRNKRQRTTSVETAAPAAKHRVVQSTTSTPDRQIRDVSPHTAYLRSAVEESDELVGSMDDVLRTGKPANAETPRRTPSTPEPELPLDTPGPEFVTTPGLRHTKVRELLHLVVNESLRVGGRPDSAVAEDTDGGELIEVWTKTAKGGGSGKVIEWCVDPRVPETVFGKLILVGRLEIFILIILRQLTSAISQNLCLASSLMPLNLPKGVRYHFMLLLAQSPDMWWSMLWIPVLVYPRHSSHTFSNLFQEKTIL